MFIPLKVYWLLSPQYKELRDKEEARWKTLSREDKELELRIREVKALENIARNGK